MAAAKEGVWGDSGLHEADWGEATEGGVYEADYSIGNLSFSADAEGIAAAALAQDEVAYAAQRAINETAASRHFGKDPRDMIYEPTA